MWADAQRDGHPATLLECRAVTLPMYENARLGRKVNFAPGKIPFEGKSPRKCIYSVPAQETAKHRAKFVGPPFSDVRCSNEAKNRLNRLKFAGGAPNSRTDLSR